MKKAFFVIFALLLYTSFLPLFTPETTAFSPKFEECNASIKQVDAGVSAKAAALIGPNGEVLFEKNGNMRLGIASTTKIMTAIIVIESCSLDEEVATPSEAVGVEGSSLYLKKARC